MAEKHTPYSLSNWLHYLSVKEIDFLIKLTAQLGIDPVVVNIGAGGGTSAMTFLYARPDLKVITIDIQNDVTPVGGLQNEREILEASGLDYQYRYEAIHGDSKAVGMDWQHGPVDMVFVDGDHTREGCAGDIIAWLPNLKPNGIIALHDFRKVRAYQDQHPDAELTSEFVRGVIKPYPGVDDAVANLLMGNDQRVKMIDIVDTLVAFRVEK